MSRMPNVVICTCDQLRAFEVGCYGNAVIRTPHIDRLAAEGVRFETAVTNFPVCMAARSVLLSGQHNRTCTGGVSNVAYPSRPGDFSMPEYPEAGRPHFKDATLAEVLRDRGYETATIGKWHIHCWPHEVGFDHYLIPRVHHCHTGQSFTEDGGPEFVPPGTSVDFEADRVEAFLAARRSADRPFFLFYNIAPPHCPLADAPEKYLTMYRPDEVPLRPNVDPDRPLDRQDYWFRVYRYDFRYYMLHLPYTDELPRGYDLRHLIAEYYGLTTWADDTVGRLLAALDAAGLAEDTIVVFTSDHGDNLGSLGLVQKSGPNEESIRVPLLVRGPGVAPHVVSGQVAGLVDLMPTVLSMVGAPTPARIQGQDLSPLICGERERPDRDHAFVETNRGCGVRTPDHLYFAPYAKGTRTPAAEPSDFYDLAADPYQQTNLAGTGRQADLAAGLDCLLREWDARTPWMREAPA